MPGGHVWAFLGDGETDEPETLGAITLASRERLDNLIFVINCNLQRLDGPVRGNGHIVQELEAVFQGAGWNVVKVLWSSDGTRSLKRTRSIYSPAYLAPLWTASIRNSACPAPMSEEALEHEPRLEAYLNRISDEQLRKLRRGGHDPVKVFAAYHHAVNHGKPHRNPGQDDQRLRAGESGGKNIPTSRKN